MPAIEASGLSKRYGSHEALAGIDLRIDRGSAFGLIGLNGTGKTTFIKLLLGVVRPTAGQVRVLGGSPDDREIRARIGYLPERLTLPATLHAEGFLRSIARLKGLQRPESDIDRQLDRVGLREAAHRRIGGFSKGMRQRLGLAAALLGGPELLVLDEPTDGIDPLGRADVRRLLQEERARGATIFLNSHLLSETERICERVGIIAFGRIAREGPIEELVRSSRRFLVRFTPQVDVQALSTFGFAPAEQPFTFHVEAESPDDLDLRLQHARSFGGKLLELRPAQRDLEELLAEAVEAA